MVLECSSRHTEVNKNTWINSKQENYNILPGNTNNSDHSPNDSLPDELDLFSDSSSQSLCLHANKIKTKKTTKLSKSDPISVSVQGILISYSRSLEGNYDHEILTR